MSSVRSTCSAYDEHDEEAMMGIEQHLMSPKATTKHPRHRTGCTCIVCLQSPSGAGPKHDKCCSCTVCDAVKRRRRSLLLRREKKQIKKDKNAHKELESQNSDEELRQCVNISKNHEHHHTSPLTLQIDLNFQPEKDEESLTGSNTTTKNNKSLHHDDTVKSSFKPPSSSSPYSQIDKEDEGKLKRNTETADITKSSS